MADPYQAGFLGFCLHLKNYQLCWWVSIINKEEST